MENIDYTPDQRREIELGMVEGLNVHMFANPEFLAIQMREIRLGLRESLPVEYYATPKYDWLQMAEIRQGLMARLNVDKYADPSIPFDVMRQIRLGLEEDIDLSEDLSLPAGVLKEPRLALEENIDIRKYIQEGYNEEQLHEIRLGLEARIPVAQYKNAWFLWQQMQEIRLGLQEGLDVTPYARLMYTGREMHRIRRTLVRKQLEEQRLTNSLTKLPVNAVADSSAEPMKKSSLESTAKEPAKPVGKKEFEDFTIMVPDDGMSASVFVTEIGTKIPMKSLVQSLMEHGVVSGIKQDALQRLEQDGADAPLTLVAEGTPPQTGEDGYYEFFFDRNLKKTPKIQEDGSVDYQNVKWFELVKQGQRIALYHPAEAGEYGMKVTGEILPGKKGRQLPPLRGRGFSLLKDQVTYEAAIEGKIDYTEGADLEAAGDIILKRGNNAELALLRSALKDFQKNILHLRETTIRCILK